MLVLADWLVIGAALLCATLVFASFWEERHAQRRLRETREAMAALRPTPREWSPQDEFAYVCAERAARDLLWSLLSPVQQDEYSLHGSVTVPSTLYPARTYHLRARQISIREGGMEVGRLCSQFAEPGLPTADWTLAMLLHIQSDEGEWLAHRAHRLVVFPPHWSLPQ